MKSLKKIINPVIRYVAGIAIPAIIGISGSIRTTKIGIIFASLNFRMRIKQKNLAAGIMKVSMIIRTLHLKLTGNNKISAVIDFYIVIGIVITENDQDSPRIDCQPTSVQE